MQTNFPTLQITDESSISALHEATLRILRKVGVAFQDEEALSILTKAGCEVDGRTVHFQEKTVLQALDRCPPSVILRARNPDKDVQLGSGKVHYANGFGAICISDSRTGEQRPATRADLQGFVTIGDFLPNLHVIVMEILPQDVPPTRAHLEGSIILLSHTDKHVIVAAEGEGEISALMEIADYLIKESGGGEPTFSTGATSTSPLSFEQSSCLKLIQSAKRGIPSHITCGAIAGATSPVTLAGTLAVQNAEVLAGVVLAQSVNPGCPTMYGTFASVMEMRRGGYVNGGPEAALMNAATSQLCKLYGLPLGYGTAGSVDSPVVDFQAGLEKAMGILLCALTGPDLIHDSLSGQLAKSLSSSFGQMVLSDQLCGMVNRILRGIHFSSDALAEDLVAKLGPGGEYITSDHTLSHFRDELHIPSILIRDGFATWKETGGKTALDRAEEEARKIIEEHHPCQLSNELQQEIRKIADRIIGVK